MLYLAIGSSCNVCEEQDERRAGVMRFNADGSNGKIFSTGLRNVIGLAFRPDKEHPLGCSIGKRRFGRRASSRNPLCHLSLMLMVDGHIVMQVG